MATAMEIVLPSGRFASFREPTWGDMIFAYSSNGPEMMARLAAACCEIDGAHISLEDVRQMPIADFMPILNILTEFMPKDTGSRGVA
ncbi:hypothetical protein QFZ96_004398 [Paraburkholderia youngii]